jgi:hypothetical protein
MRRFRANASLDGRTQKLHRLLGGAITTITTIDDGIAEDRVPSHHRWVSLGGDAK